MKLRTKIAGTLALPLALAVAANVNAAQITDELKVGGFIAATADWTLYDDAVGQDSDVDFGLGLGTSRINVSYTKNGVNYLYENDWAGGGKGDEYRLRHAVISYDGWVAGFTWSGFANLTALGETIDAVGPTTLSANANRTAKLGKTFNLDDSMSLGLFFEDNSHGLNTDKSTSGRNANTAIPDVVVNFNGNFGDTKVFAAARLANVNGDLNKSNERETETAVDFALGLSQNLLNDDLNIKLAVLSLDKNEHSIVDNTRSADGRDLGIQLAGQYKINDQIRTNLVIQQVSTDRPDADSTAFWLNGFYKLESGWEWGAEFVYVSADDGARGVGSTRGAPNPNAGGLKDKDMRVSLLAKYAF